VNSDELQVRARQWAAGLAPERREQLRRLYLGARRHTTFSVKGNMLRRRPFSSCYGADRGTPVDRWYLRRFVVEHLDLIRGDVLEVQGAEWAALADPDQVSRVEIIDLDPRNVRATLIADLCQPAALPEAAYDCAIVFQTLQYLSDVPQALRNLWAARRPGGVVLLSAPVTSRLDPTCGPSGDLWRFTPAGLEHLVVSAIPDAVVSVSGYGSVATGVAFLLGLPAEKLSARQLAWHDEAFPLISCAVVSERRESRS
jgi:hypothetical protein